MQGRGMGASSMAASAMTQALMESGVVIATQDANKYAAIQLQNLSGKQKLLYKMLLLMRQWIKQICQHDYREQ